MDSDIANSLGLNPTVEGEKALKVLRELSELSVEVGYHEGQIADDGSTPLAAIAYWNHYGALSEDGAIAIPARPFMDALKNNEDKLAAFCVNAIMNAENSQSAAQMMGAQSVGMIQTEITDGDWVPNAPSTIKKKGSSHPLIDTGRMRQEVHYVVKKGE